MPAAASQPLRVMFHSGLADKLGLDRYCANVDEALRRDGTQCVETVLVLNSLMRMSREVGSAIVRPMREIKVS